MDFFKIVFECFKSMVCYSSVYCFIKVKLPANSNFKLDLNGYKTEQ